MWQNTGVESSRWAEGTCFAEVLAHERAFLSTAHDTVALRAWRSHLVAEATDPQSAYASALRQVGDSGSAARSGFLENWRYLIARALERVLGQQVCDGGIRAQHSPTTGRIDADRTAVLVLAALHGGVVLNRLSLEVRPVDAALDLALAPFLND